MALLRLPKPFYRVVFDGHLCRIYDQEGKELKHARTISVNMRANDIPTATVELMGVTFEGTLLPPEEPEPESHVIDSDHAGQFLR